MKQKQEAIGLMEPKTQIIRIDGIAHSIRAGSSHTICGIEVSDLDRMKSKMSKGGFIDICQICLGGHESGKYATENQQKIKTGRRYNE